MTVIATAIKAALRGERRMSRRRFSRLITMFVALATAGGFAACSQTTQSVSSPAAAAPAAVLPASESAPAAASAAMTRERASTECWMRYEKEGRGLSLDQRLPLVEKCTTQKMKEAGS